MAAQTPSDPGPRPPVLTWGKSIPVLSVAFIFYAIRFMFEQFWLFGPVIAGFLVDLYLGGGTVGHIAGTAATAVAGGAEFFTGPVVEIFGALMAMMVGFMGWGIVLILILVTNPRFYKENAKSLLYSVGALAISVIPIVGTLPSFLGTIIALYHQQIKRDKQKLRAWEAAQKAFQEQLRLQQRAQAAQIATERAERDSATDYEDAHVADDNTPQKSQEKVTVPGEYSYDFAAQSARANENEIPDKEHKAA